MMDHEKAFSKIINGTFVITSKSGDVSNAMTAAWVTRVSHVPPLVMASIGKGRYTNEILSNAGHFCVNILSETQVEVAKKCGFQSGRTKDKLEGLPTADTEFGIPVIEGVAGYLVCKIVERVEAGDHILYVGEVLSSGSNDKEGLVARMSDYF